jgi:peptidyl-prolyl cis-trans isomerase B (cyclophilin B)
MRNEEWWAKPDVECGVSGMRVTLTSPLGRLGKKMRGVGHATRASGLLVAVLLLCAHAIAQTRPTRQTPPGASSFFTTPLLLAEMQHREAVVQTTRGPIVIALLPEIAPNHVGYFMKLAKEGVYAGTVFHRAVKLGIIQGGDPLSKDAGKRPLYGTGGLGVLKAEFSKEPMTAGAVAAVLQPGKRDSAGAQFFIAVTDQPALNGEYTIFGRVVEGLEVVRQISEAPADEQGRLTDRIEITGMTIREATPPEQLPFSTESATDLAAYRAVLETSKGAITVGLRPDKAPEHVRNFLRLAVAGIYDGTSFHRVVRGFVIQTGMVSTRTLPLTQKQEELVHMLQPEFNDLPHLPGTVSMARLDDPASASTSFFICTAPAPSLDGKYTAFGTVTAGMEIVQAIEQAPLDGEAPRERIELTKVRVEKP